MATNAELPALANRYVAAGAAWLDEREPGWERLIDLGLLSLKDPNACVLCQVVGSFWVGLQRANHSPYLGFTGPGCQIAELWDDQQWSAWWAILDAAWILLLKERFNSGSFSDG